jgi:hypothetical protein
MKPNTGELWMCTDLIDTWVGNHKEKFRIIGPGLVVGVHRNGDEFGDYYKTLFCGKITELLLNNFVERIG